MHIYAHRAGAVFEHVVHAMIQNEYMQSVTFPLSLIRSPVWLFDVDSLRIVWANPAGLNLWESPDLAELQGRNMSSDITRNVRERLDQYCTDLIGTTDTMTEHWTFYPNGSPSTFECSISAIESPCGHRLLVVNATCEDRTSLSDTLYRSNALLHTSVCVSVYGMRGQLKYSNPAARSMLGNDVTSLADHFCDQEVWQEARDALERAERVSVDARVLTKNGCAWHSLTLEACPDPVDGEMSILVSESDISSRHKAQEQVKQLAYFDTLTGLPNRTSWFGTLKSRLDTAALNGQSLAVLFVDLDRFKMINDTLGHNIGDKLLQSVSQRLCDCLGGDDYLARLGGDEFTILTEDDHVGRRSNACASALVASLAKPIVIDGHEITITPSIGIGLYPKFGTVSSELMQQADLAMYAAKEAGGGYMRFQPHMNAQIQQRRIIENDLCKALETSALKVYYQPKICACSGQITGVEALLRWNHPKVGPISPEQFIAVAEETGKVGDITRYVLHEALRQQSQWAAAGYDITMAVNVSPLEFRRGDIVAMVRHALATSGCKPQKLKLEITESMLMTDSTEILDKLGELHHLNVKLSLDDFGSGYSNLGYLQRFPLDSIKIDQSFLPNGTVSPVVDLIIGVGKKLSLTVVAEGVETRRQRDFLMEHGCHQLQGFLFSKPLPEPEATVLLRRWKVDKFRRRKKAGVAA